MPAGATPALPTLTATYNAPQCGCTVHMPAPPSVQHVTQPGAGGIQLDVTDVSVTTADKSYYGLAYWALPHNTTYDENAGIDGIVRNAQGTNVSQHRNLTVSGFPAKAVTFHSGANIVEAMVLSAKGRAYTLVTIGHAQPDTDAAFTAFTKAFRIN